MKVILIIIDLVENLCVTPSTSVDLKTLCHVSTNLLYGDISFQREAEMMFSVMGIAIFNKIK
jgi:hypothetical protein